MPFSISSCCSSPMHSECLPFPIFALLLNILWVWHTAAIPSACSLLWGLWWPFHSFLPLCPLHQLTELKLNLSKPWCGSFSSPSSSDLTDLVFGTVSCSAGFVYLSGLLLILSPLCLCTGHPLSRCPHKTGVLTNIYIPFMSYVSFPSTHPTNLLYWIRKASYQEFIC